MLVVVVAWLRPQSFLGFLITTSHTLLRTQLMHASRSTTMSDVEKMIGDYSQLTNHNIRSFLWRGVSVSVKDRQTHEDKPILNNVSGIVYAGELMAVMGPSYVVLRLSTSSCC